MWSFPSFAQWVIANPLRNKSSRKLLNVRETILAHDVSLSAASLDFGTVRQGSTSKVFTLRIKNVGFKPLDFLTARVPSEFVCLSEAFGTVQPGSEVTFRLQFAPQIGGEKYGDLVIPVVPIGSITVPLTGICKPYTFLHNGLHRYAGKQNYDGDVNE